MVGLLLEGFFKTLAVFRGDLNTEKCADEIFNFKHPKKLKKKKKNLNCNITNADGYIKIWCKPD